MFSLLAKKSRPAALAHRITDLREAPLGSWIDSDDDNQQYWLQRALPLRPDERPEELRVERAAERAATRTAQWPDKWCRRPGGIKAEEAQEEEEKESRPQC